MERRLGVVTIEDAAQQFVTTPEAVIGELEAGRLRGFRVGGEWRTTEAALLEFIEEASAAPGGPGPNSGSAASDGGDSNAEDDSGAPIPDLAGLEWREVGPQDYRWPKDIEGFEGGYETKVTVGRRQLPVRVVYCNRKAYGRDRRRTVVLVGQRMYPVVEFVGADEFDKTGLMASFVKPQGREHLRPGGAVPAEYDGLPRDIFTNLVTGPYSPESIAVVAHKDDRNLMARHGLIRARQKNML